MVVTNIVCAVVAVVVLGGDGAGGRARGVDHFTSSQQSPRCSSSPSCLPHDLEPAPSSPVFALGRGPRRGSCRVLVRSLVGGGSLLQPARARTAEPGATQATEYLSQLVQTTAVLSQPSKFCKGQITDLYDIVVRSGLEAWRGTCAASAMLSRSQVRGCSAAWLVRVCCHRERGAGSTGSSRAERTE